LTVELELGHRDLDRPAGARSARAASATGEHATVASATATASIGTESRPVQMMKRKNHTTSTKVPYSVTAADADVILLRELPPPPCRE